LQCTATTANTFAVCSGLPVSLAANTFIDYGFSDGGVAAATGVWTTLSLTCP
jgi:hypothetical protein